MVLLNLTCPPSYRLVEEAVSNGTIWSPLPCPPLPSHPQDLTLSDTEQPSLPMVHVFTVPVTTPTTTRVITTSSSYCDPPLHSLSRSSLPVSLSLGHPLPLLPLSTFYQLSPSLPPLSFFLSPSFPPSSSRLSLCPHPVGEAGYCGCSSVCRHALFALCIRPTVGEAEDKAATSLLFTCCQIHKKHPQ